MDWKQIPTREVGMIADEAIDYLHSTGQVKNAYYRIHDNHFPVIYAQLAGGRLDGLRIIIRDDSIENIIDRMDELPDPYSVYDTPAGCRGCGAVISRGEQHARSCENAED